jgi:hypothetical protein
MEAVVTGSVVVTTMCLAMAAFYFKINSQTTQNNSSSPVSQATLDAQIIDATNQVANKTIYSNLWNARIGFPDNNTIIQTSTIDKRTCKALCDETLQCVGFQMDPTGQQCDLLKNVSNTYSFTTEGWNLFLNGNKTQNKRFDTPFLNQEVSGSLLGTTMTDVKSVHQCGMLCTSNNSCVSFSVGSGGCELFTNQTSIRVPNPLFDTYPVISADIGYTNWNPSPSPSP